MNIEQLKMNIHLEDRNGTIVLRDRPWLHCPPIAVESISPHIESNTEQRWKLRFGNMSPLFCRGGRRLHCGLCAGAGQRQLLGEDQELLEGTLVYRSTLHSFRE